MGSYTQPNILLISTDQQRADHLGCYGNKTVRTPTIDSLGARGTIFDRFYVACPICMPNRIAMLTGRMPSVNGSRHNGIPLSLDAVTYVDVLRAGGYHTGIVGKCHAQNITGHELKNPDIFERDATGKTPPSSFADAHMTPRVGPEYEAELMPLWRDNPDRNEPPLPYYGYDYVRFANGHSDNVQGHYTGWLKSKTANPEALYGPKNALPGDSAALKTPQSWRSAMPEELYPTTYVAEESKAFIQHHLESQPEKPFYLHCSFTDPHHPFSPPGKYFDMYDPAEMELPKSYGNQDENAPDYLKQLRRDQVDGTADKDGPFPFCVTEDEVRGALALTYGMITMVDDAVAGLMTYLEENGLSDNTIVIFTSDHGDFMGDHGLMLKHGLHYEGVIRVPLVWYDPTTDQPARSTVHGSSVDISKMILTSAGLQPNNGNQGVDLNAIAQGKADTDRRGILIEEDELGAHLNTEHGVRVRTYVEENWRLTLWQGMAGGELFDRNADPHETTNLWNNAKYASKKGSLLEGMLRETIRLTDTAPLATHIA